MATINAVLDALKTDIDTELSGLINASYDYQTMPDRLNRSYVLYWYEFMDDPMRVAVAGSGIHSFACVLSAQYEKTPASQRDADRDLNDMVDTVIQYLQGAKNRTLWVNIVVESALRGGPDPDIKNTSWRIIPFKVTFK